MQLLDLLLISSMFIRFCITSIMIPSDATSKMTIRTIINIDLTDSQDLIRTLQMTIRTIINIALTDPQDLIRTLQMTIRTIINIVLSNLQDTIKTLLWGCILTKWNSPLR